MTGYGHRVRVVRGVAIACAAAIAATLVIATPAVADAQVTPVASCDELADAFATTGTVLLTQDISGPGTECAAVEIGAGADIVLDIGGHTAYFGSIFGTGPTVAEGAAIFVPSDASLTVRGVTESTGAERAGFLVASGGAGAGIGARPGSGASGDIRIEGGIIRAESRSAAGIGGADGDAHVTITGGNVTAFASLWAPYVDSGAGIGGGRQGIGRVEVTGGTANGSSFSGAGIGGGSDGDGIVTIAVPDDARNSLRGNAGGGSHTGAGIGGGIRGSGQVVITGGTVSGTASGDGLGAGDRLGVGYGDVRGLGAVSISGRPHVSGSSIRSSRTEILGGSVSIVDGLRATDPRPVAGTTPLSPIFVSVRKDGQPVRPGLLVVVDDRGTPTGYEAVPELTSASLWLPPGRRFIRTEVDGEVRTFPVQVAADGTARAFLDFGAPPPPPTLEQRIVARFAELARRLGSDDAAIARIARELGTTEGTVRYWLRRAGEIG
ncbi:hypothetical protein [Agromyces sp. Marseille-Q5079]|uniref:hypothetical protein n=1 Tax=Agromyces sp. Marseille-Q5079 TaxID=3439059 RepID=UPI003D9C8688